MKVERTFMKLSRRTLVSLALVAAGLVAAFACSSASTSDPSCDPVCATVDECGGTSCLAYCIALRTGCEEKGQQAAFAAWASCEATPGTLSCTNGSFVPTSCALENIGVIACQAGVDPLGSGTGIGTIGFSTGPGTGTGFSTATDTTTGSEINSGTGFSSESETEPELDGGLDEAGGFGDDGGEEAGIDDGGGD